jgi:hypothetical protein
MYPRSNEDALVEQLNAERAISDLVELALDVWLPLAESTDSNQSDQWEYLVDAVVLYGISILAADAYDQATAALTGEPLAEDEGLTAAGLLPDFEFPGLPSRAELAAKVRGVLSRRTGVDPESVEQRMSRVSRIRSFAADHVESIRGRVVDAVGKVFRRQRDADSPDEIYDPLDPEWQSAADTAGQTHATGTLNAAVSAAADAAQDRGVLVEWVAILDTHTRDAHALADGQRQPAGVPFSVGGEELRFPGDPRGSLDNVINCRCRLFARFTEPDPELTAAGLPSDIETFNWVDECGGLPKYIKRISKHLREKGMAESRAIATAVNAVKKMCATGDVNFPGRQNVNDISRAQACKAVEEWERLKACAARKRSENAATPDNFATEEAECIECMSADTDQGDKAVGYRSFSGVLAVIGEPTDDGRMFADDIDLSFRDFPLPLMWCKQSSGGHMDAYTVGVIEHAEIDGTQVLGSGYFLDTPEALEAITQVEHGVTGPSVDLGDASWELRDDSGTVITEENYYDLDPDAKLFQTVTAAKMLAATLVSTPAFGSTSITLGDETDVAEESLVAAAGMPKPGTIDMPVYSAEMFADPGFDGPTLPHITEDGRIMGHLAAFNVCHTGIQDACVIAPRSQTDYAWFHTAPPVKTDQGTVKVGRLTVGGGHAGPRLSAGPAIAHYDDAGTCFALVHVGEDEHGIWFSGVAAPGATAEQVAAGLSAPLSGDWRNVGGNLELVAALAVNTPGFPILASGATDSTDAPIALVASLGPCAEDRPETPELAQANVEELARKIAAEMRAADKRDQLAAEIIAAERRREAAALIEGMV